jgi:hypothetical protein
VIERLVQRWMGGDPSLMSLAQGLALLPMAAFSIITGAGTGFQPLALVGWLLFSWAASVPVVVMAMGLLRR